MHFRIRHRRGHCSTLFCSNTTYTCFSACRLNASSHTRDCSVEAAEFHIRVQSWFMSYLQNSRDVCALFVRKCDHRLSQKQKHLRVCGRSHLLNVSLFCIPLLPTVQQLHTQQSTKEDIVTWKSDTPILLTATIRRCREVKVFILSAWRVWTASQLLWCCIFK